MGLLYLYLYLLCVDLLAFNLQIAIHKFEPLFSKQEVPLLNFNVKPNNLNKGCEIWSLTLKEEHRLSVFENGMLRRIHVYGAKRDEETGEWRRLYNEEVNDLYCSPNVIGEIKLRRIKMAGHIACVGERRGEERCVHDFGGET
jgi:hypothetical protein